MNRLNDEASTTADQEIHLTREFNAPRDLVFETWTDPDKISQWWGPNGFTTSTHEMDFRLNGDWKFTMHGPDGTDYPNHIVYTEINESALLKYDHYGHMDKEGDPPHFKVTVILEDLGDKTRLTMRMIFPTTEDRDKAVEFGAVEGGNQTLSRLAEFLAKSVNKA